MPKKFHEIITKMILQSKEQFVKYVPTAAASAWEDLITYVEASERWLRTEVLGNVLYLEIHDTPGKHGDLLDTCMKIISLDAYRRAIPFLDLVQNANGFAVVSSDNLAPASRDRVNRLIEATIKERDEEIEVLISYLEDTTSYHDAWKGSKAFSVLSDCLITTAKELKLLCNWHGTRTDFLKLKPDLLLRSYTDIGKWIGREYIDELVEQQRDGDLTSDNKTVINFLKVVLANFVVGDPVNANRSLEDVITFLDKNVSKYPTYGNSVEYKVRHAEKFENSTGNPFFILGGI